MKSVRWHLYNWWAALQERNSKLREPESFIMASKHACSLLWRETLSSKPVCYAHMLNKMVQEKDSQFLCSQGM